MGVVQVLVRNWLAICPGSARIGLSFPSSGEAALAGLFNTTLRSGPGAQAREEQGRLLSGSVPSLLYPCGILLVLFIIVIAVVWFVVVELLY